MTIRRSTPYSLRPDLNVLIKRVSDLFDQLTPQQQAAHWAAQRRSWVVGEMMLLRPEMTRERAIEIYDEVTR